ncbi:BPL-N domain-containing protein [Thalassoglobus polymorphus]|uniref:Succinylglutamate desuccinylase / Aspartoacylase family protein n=1 Tax=Thalassoglobus polymorphus TaxID=2527994 RepID=A0A517QSA5_9PLAN|nr:BPL-N domain-containing protein [Thalassoglobus polymorphus]QDT34504.1 Succinylglutamate desuccinylase / Aspartoacylase family protein [Thalassoglobus polymorphus]
MRSIPKLRLIAFTTLILGLISSTQASDQPTGHLGKGTIWETPWYTIDSGKEGPTVIVTGGIHGNEPAGATAAEQIRHWDIDAGKLIVVPKVNRLGLTAETRWFPPERNNRPLRDLNRNFPTKENPAPRTPLATDVWKLVESTKPDYVVDLHEGFDFHIANSKSVGSSIIFAKSNERTELANAMHKAVNKTVTDKDRKIVLLSKSGAVNGSLVRACQDRLNASGFILETTFKDQPLSLRTRQHRVMVSTLFQKIGLIDQDQSHRVAPSKDASVIQIGMYDSAGATGNGIKNFNKLFNSNNQFNMTQIGPADMIPEVLNQFDVLLFPGGSGSKQGKAIGEKGRDEIRKFGEEGGGVVGVCAGAYLCSSHYTWSLNMINSAVFNETIEIPGVGRKSMWYRGKSSQVEMEFDQSAEPIFNRSDLAKVRYHNGPIVSKGKNTSLPDFTALAWFRSEVAKYEPQKGTMIDTPAIITAPYGKGRVLCISPHPESTPGLEPAILDAIKYVRPQEK